MPEESVSSKAPEGSSEAKASADPLVRNLVRIRVCGVGTKSAAALDLPALRAIADRVCPHVREADRIAAVLNLAIKSWEEQRYAKAIADLWGLSSEYYGCKLRKRRAAAAAALEYTPKTFMRYRQAEMTAALAEALRALPTAGAEPPQALHPHELQVDDDGTVDTDLTTTATHQNDPAPSPPASPAPASTHSHKTAAPQTSRQPLDSPISIVAGIPGSSGEQGDGGQATTAQLHQPSGLAVDPGKTLYLADAGNHRVRQIDFATGTISTLAGTGNPNYWGDDGPATDAALFYPEDLALDLTSQHLYVADTHNHCVRRVDLKTGIITTVAGTGKKARNAQPRQIAQHSFPNALRRRGHRAASTRLSSPRGLALDDRQGRLYIADTERHLVLCLDVTTSILTTVAGTGEQYRRDDKGRAIKTALVKPFHLAFEPGATALYMTSADAYHPMRKLALATGRLVAFWAPQGASCLTIDPDQEVLYLSLTNPASQTDSILRADLLAKTFSTLAGKVQEPMTCGGLAFDRSSRSLYWSDYNKACISCLAVG